MYKNQLQELAQRSCFNLPSYACTREGPDHAPRFKACVNFNGEVFESPTYCTTLRQAEHSAAEVALNNLSTRGPSRSLTARVLDETGVYKNLLQETAHRAGLKLPVYTTVRSGPGHVPVFTCSVELAGMNFTGESAKTKKQAEKNAAIAAWSALKTMPNLVSFFESSRNAREEEEQNPARRRDHHQNQGGGGRRMVRSLNSNGGGSPINHLQLHHDQQRRLMDLLISEENGSSSSSTAPKKQNMSFVSLLPPPPPRTTSKILPPLLLSTTIRPTPSSVQVKRQEVQPPLDQDQDQDHQVLASKSATASRNVYGANSMYRRRYEKQTHNSIKSNLVGPDQMLPSQLIAAISSSINFSPPTTCSRSIINRGFAPAVQIRSVIPVCAAAPVRPSPPHQLQSKSNPPPSGINKEAQPIAPAGEVLSESSSGQLTPQLKGKLQL